MSLLKATLVTALSSGGGFWTLIAFTFLSEDIACICAGVLVARGDIDFFPAAVGCFLGIFLGDVALYVLGRCLGQPVLKWPPVRWLLKEKHIERARIWFARKGTSIIFTSRMIPGSRMPVYFAAGLLKQPLGLSMIQFFVAAALWAPALVGLSALVGEQILSYYESWKDYALGVLIAIAILIYLVIVRVIPLFTWKGRRLAWGLWNRSIRWEFWPWWMVYPPVLLYMLWLGLVRYKNLFAFTAANPSIPASGFVGESKSAILAGLAGAGRRVAQWTLLAASGSPEERLQKLKAFQALLEQPYPIVLKPDAGERGTGVQIIRTEDEALRYLAFNTVDTLAQEFIPGLEYGVFYVRHPQEAQGRIWGITDKRFTSVRGDGRHTLEELILSDPRAVFMAPVFLERHEDRLDEVPPAGQTVVLAEIGNHCRGSLFLDGSSLCTPELTAEIDAISRNFRGFHFGRYDVRCPSVEDFQAGRNLKVIELNGVTSEGTWIYDPSHPLPFAWKVLCEQWRLAYEIGSANARAGAPTLGIREFISLFRKTAKSSV